MNPTIIIPFFLLLFGISACKVDQYISTPARTLEEPVIVVRKPNGAYELYIPESDETTWQVFRGRGSVAQIDWRNPVVGASGTLFFEKFPDRDRQFFALVNPQGDTLIASERQIPLKKVVNLRDLGGIPTADGKQLHWGLLFRSSRLNKLSKKEQAYLEKGLDITTVHDFRFEVEVKRHPDALPDSIHYYRHPIGGEDGGAYEELRRLIMKGEIDGSQTKDRFTELMTIFADSAAYYFQPILEQMLSPNSGPILYHCSGGKDRTGYMTVIILSALGVDRETIRQDYLMSNYYRFDENKRKMRLGRLLGIDYETMYYTFVVQEEYLNAVFDIIDAFGGTEIYLEKKFGLNESLRQILRTQYTY